jgi:hypothetical protein
MRKPRSHIGTSKAALPCLIFSFDELVFLKKALIPLEQMMLAQKEPVPNRKLALATVTRLQTKIQLMIERGLWGEEVELDFNEVVILQTSVWIFEATLEMAEPSPQKEQAQQRCQTLKTLLATPIKQTHGSH